VAEPAAGQCRCTHIRVGLTENQGGAQLDISEVTPRPPTTLQQAGPASNAFPIAQIPLRHYNYVHMTRSRLQHLAITLLALALLALSMLAIRNSQLQQSGNLLGNSLPIAGFWLLAVFSGLFHSRHHRLEFLNRVAKVIGILAIIGYLVSIFGLLGSSYQTGFEGSIATSSASQHVFAGLALVTFILAHVLLWIGTKKLGSLR
jgi:hypothetical protein